MLEFSSPIPTQTPDFSGLYPYHRLFSRKTAEVIGLSSSKSIQSTCFTYTRLAHRSSSLFLRTRPNLPLNSKSQIDERHPERGAAESKDLAPHITNDILLRLRNPYRLGVKKTATQRVVSILVSRSYVPISLPCT